MENSTIEKFIEENLHQYLALGTGKSKESVDELKKLLLLLSEENIYQIEQILCNSGSPKIKILTAKLCCKYAKEVMNQKRLSELLNTIQLGISNSIPFNLDLF